MAEDMKKERQTQRIKRTGWGGTEVDGMPVSAHDAARFVQHQPQTQQNNTRPDALDTRDTCVSRHGLAPKCVSWCFVSVSAFPLSAILVWPMPRWSLLPAAARIRSRTSWSHRAFSSSSPARAQTASDQQPGHRWGDTLQLPKTNFPLYNDPSKDERIRVKTTEGLYTWQVRICVCTRPPNTYHSRDQWQNANGPLFVFLDGPPYANGDLHMGKCLLLR